METHYFRWCAVVDKALWDKHAPKSNSNFFELYFPQI